VLFGKRYKALRNQGFVVVSDRFGQYWANMDVS